MAMLNSVLLCLILLKTCILLLILSLNRNFISDMLNWSELFDEEIKIWDPKI